MNVLARLLNKLQRNGYTIGVVSWLAKNSTEEYDESEYKDTTTSEIRALYSYLEQVQPK